MKTNKTNIFLQDVMEKDFPILDVSVSLATCFKRMNGKETALVIENGRFKGIVEYDDLLYGFLQEDRELTIGDIIQNKNNQNKKFKILSAEVDASDALQLMHGGTDFILVKDNDKNGNGNIIGIVTKHNVADIESLILEKSSISIPQAQ